jgi:hypothetical protein
LRVRNTASLPENIHSLSCKTPETEKSIAQTLLLKFGVLEEIIDGQIEVSLNVKTRLFEIYAKQLVVNQNVNENESFSTKSIPNVFNNLPKQERPITEPPMQQDDLEIVVISQETFNSNPKTSRKRKLMKDTDNKENILPKQNKVFIFYEIY